MQRRSLASLATFIVLFTLLIFNSNWIEGQVLKPSERIYVDMDAELQVIPKSLCVTEDQVVIIPDQSGIVKIFYKEGNFLKFIRDLGPNFGEAKFMEPWYCFYSIEQGKLGVIDYKARKVFIFKREGKVDFSCFNIFECNNFAYDMDFTGDGKSVVVSGAITDEENKHYNLYSIDIKSGKIKYLLPSYELYDLKNEEEYYTEYREKQTLPAIGIKNFFDRAGDNVFCVWEGLPRIIQVDLKSDSFSVLKSKLDEQKSSNFSKPDSQNLAFYYKKGEFSDAWKERDRRSYVRNIFATSDYIFLVYEAAKDRGNSTLWLQKYSLEGSFLGEQQLLGNPGGQQMWLDKDANELYTFSTEEINNYITILKYKIHQ